MEGQGFGLVETAPPWQLSTNKHTPDTGLDGLKRNKQIV